MQPLRNIYTNLVKDDRVKKLLITLLFFVLPWNLGKHVELPSSFVHSILIPYLAPTMYIQDILIIFVIFLRLPDFVSALFPATGMQRGVGFLRSCPATVALSGWFCRATFLFLMGAFLSIFFSERLYPSVYFFARLVTYTAFFGVVAHLFRDPFVRRWFSVSLLVNLVLLCVLGFLQFHRQASVFSNYLFFGEQPYTVYTPYIAKESFDGIAKIPPYGTFEHPNILAGYLVVSLTLSLRYLVKLKKHRLLLSGFFMLLSTSLLFLTKSYTAWVACALGFLLVIFARFMAVRYPRSLRLVPRVFLILTLAIISLGLAFPFYKARVAELLPEDSTITTLSVDRRSALLSASYGMVAQKPFFGWGINSFTYNFEPFYIRPDAVRFLQPVHNVYALVASEVGVACAVVFAALSVCAVWATALRGGVFYSIALIQITLLSSFDHYFFTIPQTLLLLFLTLMIGLTYTKSSDCL
jgi:O-antigen ligase